MKSRLCNEIFQAVISDYHISDNVNQTMPVKFPQGSIKLLLYKKAWVDCVQWHLEDNVRNPQINPVEGVLLKRKIDLYNETRTNLVEKIDDFLISHFSKVKIMPSAKFNSESPAWIIDRLSILNLKVFHMNEETKRTNASTVHIKSCEHKLITLQTQAIDLSNCLDDLLNEIKRGQKYIKVYRQFKMYNDPNLNPVLYQKNEAF